MYTKKHLYNRIVLSRRSGLTIPEIASRFNLSKSTVSVWCKDVRLSPSQKKVIHDNWVLATKDGRLKGAESNKNKKIERVKQEEKIAREKIGHFSPRDAFIAGVALYWAEGSKKDRGEGFNFINSDPGMIAFMISWLTKHMKVPKEDIKINICINASHEKRIGKILSFWSNLLDFPQGRFGNTIYIRVPHKKVYKNEESYYGMVRIQVSESSWLRRRINGMIKCLALPA